MKTQTSILALAMVVTVATLMIAYAIGPKPITTSTEHTGDDQLAEILQEHAPSGSHNLAGFIQHTGDTTFAGLGADEHSEFEIGSITKTFTAELLSNAIERGELSLQTKVGEILAAEGTEIADVNLEELATHTSGLPRMSRVDLKSFTYAFTGSNPYSGYTNEKLVDDSLTASTKGRGDYEYSNFGVALLGQLIAKQAGTSYTELLQTEILDPVGMKETYLMTPGSVPADAPRGLLARGHDAAPWEMDADAPAGAIRSTAHDMALYAQHTLNKPIPDYTWVRDSPTNIFHNGGTGGFRSMLILDPESNSAAFVINDSTSGVDDLGDVLIQEARS